jgi:hypothetical protein
MSTCTCACTRTMPRTGLATLEGLPCNGTGTTGFWCARCRWAKWEYLPRNPQSDPEYERIADMRARDGED